MRIVAYSTAYEYGQVLLSESTGESVLSPRIDELFSFLLEPYEETLKVTWDLDATVSAFLRLMDGGLCHDLRKTKRCRIGNFKVFYIPDKVFSVSHGGQKANLYGLEQFYPELEEPSLEEVQLLGMKLLWELRKMGFRPTKLTSPVAIYEECVLSKLDLPLAKDMAGACEYALRCSGRLWIESHQVGFQDPAYSYDLASAFPTILKDLADFREFEWVQSDKYQKKAVYGYAKVVATIYDWVMVSPIIADTERALISPTGTWETYLTKGEMDFITKWGIGEFKILDGWWAVTTRQTFKRPLKLEMEKLLQYKQGSGLQRLLAKRMSSGVYGKLGEERSEEFGPYFNPCWFAEISTQARLQVAEFLYSHDIGPGDNEGYQSLIAITVDGVLLDKPVVATQSQWRLAYEGPCLVVSSGLIYTEHTRPKGLTLGEVLSLIKEHPARAYYEKTLRRRLTLGDALAQDRLSDIGKPMDFAVSINLISGAHDRDFPKLPQNGRQLLSKKFRSKPIKEVQ